MRKFILAASLILSSPVLTSAEEPAIQKVILSDEELLAGMRGIYMGMQDLEPALQEIRSSTEPFVERLHRFHQLWVPVEISVCSNTPDFHIQYNERALQNPALVALIKQKWVFLFEHAFGITESPVLTLDQARKIQNEINIQVTSEDFLKKIEGVMAAYENADFAQKQKAILAETLPIKMSVIEKYGFQGEEGYIQYEIASLDHFLDAELSESLMHTTQALLPYLFKH